MKRRTFFGALAALVATPSALLRLKAAPVETAIPLEVRYSSGLAHILEDSPHFETLHGLSRSTYAEWNTHHAILNQFERQVQDARRYCALEMDRMLYGPSTGHVARHASRGMRLVPPRESFREWAARVG